MKENLNIQRDKKGCFIKGRTPWNKGLTKDNNEILKKISLIRKGKKSEEIYGKEKSRIKIKKQRQTLKRLYKEGKLYIPSNLGGMHSDNTKRIISNASKINWKNKEYRKKYSETKLKLYKNNEKYLDKLRNIAINSWKNNEVKQKRIKGMIKHASENPVSEETRNKRSKSLKKHSEFFSKAMKERRKTMKIPIKDTSIEVKIQNFLKQLGIEFFTHQYMKEIEHGYQCDILIPVMNLVIECDGDYWHKYPIGNDIDHIRTKELIDKGFKVLRLWEFEIKKMDINEFKERIK